MNNKESMKESSWIEVMQEEIHEFDQLEVWELVPRPDNTMRITLKWIFNVTPRKFPEDPKTSHLEAIKRIFRYIKGTMHLGLWYPKGSDIETIVYVDSDHAGDYVDHKSTSGVCTFMGCCLTSWFSKKQTALVISTAEAEYVSVGKACQQDVWMKQALIDYGI
ncbi:hypothetical protein Tco_1408140 [Tanacetum coccineum]